MWQVSSWLFYRVRETHLILHTFTFFTWRLSHHPHCSHSFIAGALSLQASFHSALSFNGQSDAEEDQHQGVGQESNGEGTSNQLPSDGGKDGSDDSTKESQVEELLHSVGDTKVHKTGQNHAFNTAATLCQYEDIYHFIARRMASFWWTRSYTLWCQDAGTVDRPTRAGTSLLSRNEPVWAESNLHPSVANSEFPLDSLCSLRLIRYCLRFIQVALVWFRGFIWIDVIFLKSSLWGVFILIFTLDFEILSTRRNDVAWSFRWILNAVWD